MRNISDKIVEKIKTHFVVSKFSFRKSWRLQGNVEKYCGAGQIADGNIIRRMRFR
jgi:hypothetical protein